MPDDGEPIIAVSDIHAHVRGRCVDLLSGSEGERLLCADGPPWLALSDITQARNLASIICSSNEAIKLYLDFCRAEAAALVAKHSASIRAVAAALIEHRTLTGGEIVAVVAESIAREAMAAERARRLDWRERTETPRVSIRRPGDSRAASGITPGSLLVCGVKRTWPNWAGMSQFDPTETLASKSVRVRSTRIVAN
jgi:hypothetical protein